MKRNVFRKALSLILTLAVTLGMTSTVFAAEQTKNGVLMITDSKVYVGENSFGMVLDENAENDPVISTVTSSDPSVAKIVSKTSNDWTVKGIKPGTVTLTVNYTFKGQADSMTASMKVEKRPIVFKSLKVNGKSVKVAKYQIAFNKKAKSAKTVKIKAAPAKGWKVKSVKAYAFKSMNQVKGNKVKVTSAQVKKGKKIKFAKKYQFMIVDITMVNSSTGQKEDYVVQFYRKKPAVS